MTRGAYMRKARRAAGLTLEQLSKKSGITPQHIGALERDTRNASIETCELLADALCISIDKYVGHEVVQSRIIEDLNIVYDKHAEKYVAKNGAEIIGEANSIAQITNIIREYSSTK